MSRLLALEGGSLEGAILLKLGTWKEKMPVDLSLYGSFTLKDMETLPQPLPIAKLGMRPLPLSSLSSAPQDLYLLIMKDESLYQDLREDTLRLHQLVETVELK